MSIEVQGLQESLRVLNRLEPELKKEFAKNVQRIARPLKDTIDGRIPKQSPLSGWDHNGPKGWAPKKVSVRTDTRLPRRRLGSVATSTIQVIKISTKGSSAAIADMAGKAGGGSSRRSPKYQRPNFAPALTAALGEPSRFMWRDTDAAVEQITEQLKPLIRDVENAATRALMRIR